MIGMRDFNTRQRAFRLPASELGTFDDLFQRTYASSRRNRDDSALHFHFHQNTPCTPIQLLNERDWDDGEYFIGGRIEFFAHFVEREARDARLGSHTSVGDRGGRAAVEGLMSPARLPSTRRGTTSTPRPGVDNYSSTPDMTRFQNLGGPHDYQGIPPRYPPLYPPAFTSTPPVYPPLQYPPRYGSNSPFPPFRRHPPPPSQTILASPSGNRSQQRRTEDFPRSAASRVLLGDNQPPPRRRLNSDSTTVYSLCTPIPHERYGNRQYYSGPWVFIPYPPISSSRRVSS